VRARSFEIHFTIAIHFAFAAHCNYTNFDRFESRRMDLPPQVEHTSDEGSSSTDEEHQEEAMLAPPSAFVCPLTLEVMRDPVVSRYGQSYERGAIMEWLAAGHETCPMTRQPLRMSGLITNQQLRMKIRRWQLDNDLDISLVGDASNEDFDDDRRVMIYFTLPDLEDDIAERSHDDPNVIVETEQRARQIRRILSRTHPAAVPTPAPQREKRPGFLGRLLSRRSIAA
jgi:U-box domain